jgi:hypothetical protein
MAMLIGVYSTTDTSLVLVLCVSSSSMDVLKSTCK